MDAGLTLPGLPSDDQPGVHVRRLPGTTGRSTDNEVLDYHLSMSSIGVPLQRFVRASVDVLASRGLR